MTRLASLARDRATPSASYASLFMNHYTIPRSTASDRRSLIGTCISDCRRWLRGYQEGKIFPLDGDISREGGGRETHVRVADCAIHGLRLEAIFEAVGVIGSDGSGSACYYSSHLPPPPQQTKPPPACALSASSYLHHQLDQPARLNPQRPPVPTTTQKKTTGRGYWDR